MPENTGNDKSAIEEPIYHIKVVESSANKIASTKVLTTKTTEITYTYDKPVRDEINRIRARSKIRYYTSSLNFFDSRYIKGDRELDLIREDVRRADRELKAISPYLGASIVCTKLDSRYIRESEEFEKFRLAIKTQIYGDLFSRIKKVVERGTIPRKTVNSLLRQCDQLRNINILNDPEIDQQITAIRDQISHKMFDPIITALEKEISDMDNPILYLEPEEEKEEEEEIDPVPIPGGTPGIYHFVPEEEEEEIDPGVS